ncbi:UNVERIFIED_CONTAM: VPA1262 family N-terminal domain-containing protein [Pseudomonas sp. JL1]
MRKKVIAWDAARTRSKLDELVEPGLIGFYRSVEITEILGVQDKEFTNFLTLAVAEPVEAPIEVNWNSILLNPRRLKLPGTNWFVGIAQYRLPLGAFLDKVSEFDTSGRWKPAPIDLQTGTLAAVPPQFVPADGFKNHPWNGVLKNNFFEGSHVLELFDTSKEHLRFLLNESRRLTCLAEIVGEYLPIKLDGMSDRLGNIIIQLPVTVISSEARSSSDNDHSVAIAWHPDVPPRNVRVAAEIWQDSTMTSFDAAVISTGEARLQLNSPGGGARTQIWDEDRRVLLSATPPIHFITAASISMSIAYSGSESLRRDFLLPDSSGNLIPQSLVLTQERNAQLIGSKPETPREPWVSQRVFSESVASLKARKEFVQYGLDEGMPQEAAKKSVSETEDIQAETTNAENLSRKLTRRMAALEDIRWLMKVHGGEGVWLWDPFLNADDVLRTLFFCPHSDVPLRALTAGKSPPEVVPKSEVCGDVDERELRRLARARSEQKKRDQAVQLEAARGNGKGLHLEFRIREGGAGWGFHDRFIIFPRETGSALAWSLGTSINSFGDEHHILQKVAHGEPIAQAFRELWERLEGEQYLIWKTP